MTAFARSPPIGSRFATTKSGSSEHAVRARVEVSVSLVDPEASSRRLAPESISLVDPGASSAAPAAISPETFKVGRFKVVREWTSPESEFRSMEAGTGGVKTDHSRQPSFSSDTSARTSPGRGSANSGGAHHVAREGWVR
jgi:hypothetical protein